MRKPKKEPIKTLLLFILFILSIAQIGIHLNQQSQGLPFNFLLGLFPGGTENVRVPLEPLKENYFIPEDVIVSKSQFSQWSLPQDGEYYQTIWNDVKNNYLPAIFSGKPTKVMAATQEEWQGLLAEACTRVDFHVKYPKSMLKWFTGTSADSQSFTGIKSIAILPQKDPNETVNAVYIYDESAVYMYLVDIKDKMQPKEYYRSLPDYLTQDGYMPMTAIGKVFPEIKTVDPNLPINQYPETIQTFETINIKIPDAIMLDPESDDLHSMQESILLNQKDSLTGYHDSKNAIAVFSDTDNLYTVDSHGILRYQYLPQNKPDSGDVKSAFENAVSFIELRKNLAGEADIVLTGISKSIRNDGSYEFTFSYMFNGNNIMISDIKGSGNALIPAITITASEKRVLECTWIIREIKGNKDSKDYKISFMELTNRDISLLNQLIKNISLVDIQTGYYFDAQVDSHNPVAPIWMIMTESSSGEEEYYQTLLPEAGGA